MRDLADAWENEAENWMRFARTPGHDHYRERFNWPRFVELLPTPSGGPTLDLGCGEGRAGRDLRALGYAPVVGVDAAPTMAAAARASGHYDEVLEADAAALPLPSAAFALVVAFMSLHDVDDLDGVLRETARVLAPGGRLCAAVLHPYRSALLGEASARSYFETQRYADTVERGGVTMTFHSMHRSLETLWAGFATAGLVVELVREPLPYADHVAEHPDVGRSRQRPLFLHLRARAGP